MEEALVSEQWQEEQIIMHAWCEAIESWRWLLQQASPKHRGCGFGFKEGGDRCFKHD